MSEQYVLPTGHAGERRYRLLHAVHGPATERGLASLDLKPGMSVADIGCGIGLVTPVLARLVGPTGTVVGLDADRDQLAIARRDATAQGLTWVRFVEGNIYALELPRASFDLVYARSLLSHLQQPALALREMSALVKPGGILFCEDIDMSTITTEPPTEAYRKMVRILLALAKARKADYQVGAHLPVLFQAAGYPDPHVSSEQSVFQSGELKRYWEYTFRELVPALLDAKITSPDELSALTQELARIGTDGETRVAQARMTQVWARKRNG